MIFLEAGLGRVQTLGFSADGGLLYAHTRRSGSFRAWQGPSCEPLSVPSAGSLRLSRLLQYGTAGEFVGVDGDGRVVLFDIPLSHVPRRLTFLPVKPTALAVDPEGEMLCVACESLWQKPEIRRFNLKTRKELQVLRGHDRNILSMAFSNDGATLLSGCRDGMIRFWDAHRGKERKDAFELFSRGQILQGLRQTLRQFVWTPTPEFEQDSLKNKAGIRAVAYSAEDDYLAASTGWAVTVWQLRDNGTRGQRHAVLKGHRSFINALAMSPDNRHLASAGQDGSVRIWDLESGELRQAYTWDIGAIYSLAYAPDGLRLACGGATGHVVVWDAE